MAPEQALGDAVDARADLYAWGVMAYELLAGRPPFVETSPQELIAAHVMDSRRRSPRWRPRRSRRSSSW